MLRTCDEASSGRMYSGSPKRKNASGVIGTDVGATEREKVSRGVLNDGTAHVVEHLLTIRTWGLEHERQKGVNVQADRAHVRAF